MSTTISPPILGTEAQFSFICNVQHLLQLWLLRQSRTLCLQPLHGNNLLFTSSSSISTWHSQPGPALPILCHVSQLSCFNHCLDMFLKKPHSFSELLFKSRKSHLQKGWGCQVMCWETWKCQIEIAWDIFHCTPACLPFAAVFNGTSTSSFILGLRKFAYINSSFLISCSERSLAPHLSISSSEQQPL